MRDLDRRARKAFAEKRAAEERAAEQARRETEEFRESKRAELAAKAAPELERALGVRTRPSDWALTNAAVIGYEEDPTPLDPGWAARIEVRGVPVFYYGDHCTLQPPQKLVFGPPVTLEGFGGALEARRREKKRRRR